jgi:hypothetical protein
LLSLAAAGANAATTLPSGTETVPLARRIDLTRIMLVEADYQEAVRQRSLGDLEICEAALYAMLRNEVLPHRANGGNGDEPQGTGAAIRSVREHLVP